MLSNHDWKGPKFVLQLLGGILFVSLFASTGFSQLNLIHPLKPRRLEGLAITEVLVKPSKGWGAYVEILNRNPWTGKTVDLSGYQLRTGSQRVYLIPQGTRLGPGEFLVVDFTSGKAALNIPKGSGAKVLIAGYKQAFFASEDLGDLRLIDSQGGFVDGLVWNRSPSLEETPPGMVEAVEQGYWISNRAVGMGTSRDGTLGIRRIDPFSWNSHGPSDWEFVGVAERLSPGTPKSWLGNEHQFRIRVRDKSGAPLQDVWIEVPSKKQHARTNKEGLALLEGFGKGSWNLHLKKKGYVERWVSVVRKQPYRLANLRVVLIPEAGRPRGSWEVGPEGGVFRDWSGRLEMRFPKGFVKAKTKVQAVWVDKVYSQWKERGLYDAYLGRGKGVAYAVPLGTLVVTPDLRGQGQVEVTLRAPLMSYAWEDARELWASRKKAVVEQIEGDGTTLPRSQAQVQVVQDEIVLRFTTSRFSSFVIGQEQKRRTAGEVLNFLKAKPDKWRVVYSMSDGTSTTDPEGDGHATDPWQRHHLLCGGTVSSTVSLNFSVAISQTDSKGWEWKVGAKGKLSGGIPFLVRGETEIGGEGGRNGSWVVSNSNTLTIHFEDSISHSYHFRPCKDDVAFYLRWKLETLNLGRFHTKTKKVELVRLKIWTPQGIAEDHVPSKECCFWGEDGKGKCNCKKVPPKKSH